MFTTNNGANMESYWRINVAERTRAGTYVHFFAVEVKGYDPHIAERVYKDIYKRYPATGFDVSVTRWECEGKEVDF
jgi:hypothetical protein